MRYEDQALLLILDAGLPKPKQEYRFHPKRRWRFDLAWPEQKVAVEIEGGGWVRGRHHRPAGYRQDCEKYNAAVLMGWRVLRYTPDMLSKMPDDLKQLLGGNGDEENSA